ncbi:PIG-L deacetylase family protein [Bacteroides heparinolyticus]|uniref:PIG-L deacetylase family protein n=1 Tax=Prevotella heparinolytica TaxID=28113 RepID=UPI0035A10E54
MKKYLFVVAHPDDEVLAAGATIHALTQKGNEVYMCVLNSIGDLMEAPSCISPISTERRICLLGRIQKLHTWHLMS